MTEFQGTVPTAQFVPQREMHLLVDGVGRWASSLSRRNEVSGCVGTIEGEEGYGQTAMLAALEDSCQDLGLQTVSVRAWRDHCYAPTLARRLARQLLLASDGRRLRLSPLESSADADGNASEIPTGSDGDIAIDDQEANVDLDDSGEVLDWERTHQVSTLGAEVIGELLRLIDPEDHGDGVELDPKLSRSRLIDAVAQGSTHVAARRPLILIIEDIQYADPLTHDILRHLLRLLHVKRLEGSCPRILLLLSASGSGELERTLGKEVCSMLAELREFRVRMRGVSRADLDQAAASYLQRPLTTSEREAVLRQSGGSVEMAHWLLRGLREGRLPTEESEAHGGGPRLYASVTRAPFSELDILERRITLAAAVLQRPLSVELLHLVLQASPDGHCAESDCDEAADRLVDEGWLVESVHHEYTIANSNLARAILQSAPTNELREVELHCAESLVAHADGRGDYLAVAFHLFVAADAADAAWSVAQRAIERLRDDSCFVEALTLAEDALERAPRLTSSDLFLLRRIRADLLVATENHREAIAAFTELQSATSDAHEILRFRRLCGDLHGKLGEVKEQFRQYNVALAESEKLGPSREQLDLYAALGRAYFEQGQLDKGLSIVERSLETIAEGGFCEHEVHEIYQLSANLHKRRGHFDRALQLERRIFEQVHELGRVPEQIVLLQSIAYLQVRRNKVREGEACLQRALELCRACGSRWLTADVLWSLARHWQDQKRAAQSYPFAVEALSVCLQLGREDVAQRLELLVLALELDLGDFDGACGRALRCASRVSADTRRRDPFESVMSLPSADRKTERARLEKLRRGRGAVAMATDAVVLGRLLEVDGDLDGARQLYQECLEQGGAKEHPNARVRLHQSLARIADLQGERSAIVLLEQGLAACGSGAERRVLLAALLESSAILLRRGEVSLAFDALGRGWKVAQHLSDGQSMCSAYLAVTDFLLYVGNLRGAEPFARGARRISLQGNLTHGVLGALRRLGRIVSELESWEGGERHFVEAEEHAESLRIPYESCHLKLERGWGRLRGGDFTGAGQLAREGLDFVRTFGMQSLLSECLHLVGAIDAAAENPRRNFLRSLEVFEQCLSYSERERLPRLRWEVLLNMAFVYRERGKSDLALEYVRRAEEIEWAAFARLPKKLTGLAWLPRRPCLVEQVSVSR